MKSKLIALSISLCIGSAAYLPSSNALTVVCTNCGTEWTQLTNKLQLAQSYSEQIRQTLNQVKMIDDQIKNTKALANGEWGNTFEQIERLNALARHGQSIAYSASNLTSEMDRRYKGYQNWQREITPQQYESHYQQLTQSMGDSAGAALMVANGIYHQRNETEILLNRIESRSQTATGRMEAIQAGNELSGQIIRQLQQISTLLSAQIQQTSTFIQAENEKEQLAEAQSSEFKKGDAPPLNSRKLETFELKKF